MEGQRTLIQFVLGQRMKLSEADAKLIDGLESEALEDFVLRLDKNQTPEDLQRQIAARKIREIRLLLLLLRRIRGNP